MPEFKSVAVGTTNERTSEASKRLIPSPLSLSILQIVKTTSTTNHFLLKALKSVRLKSETERTREPTAIVFESVPDRL